MKKERQAKSDFLPFSANEYDNSVKASIIEFLALSELEATPVFIETMIDLTYKMDERVKGLRNNLKQRQLREFIRLRAVELLLK